MQLLLLEKPFQPRFEANGSNSNKQNEMNEHKHYFNEHKHHFDE